MSLLNRPGGVTRDELRRLTVRMSENLLLTSCINCEHFNEQSEGCKLAGEQRPPARVIALGCPMWEEDLPF